MATIKEVAKLAGVSIGTVSNVLNGKTSNAELIDRVESAMSQLSYRPDANARSLKNTKSKLIGVLMPEICQSDHAHFLSRLENLLREQGYGILLKISNNNWLLEKKNLTQCMGAVRGRDHLVFSSQGAAYDSRREKGHPICHRDEISAFGLRR